jgi:UDPglucose 6-dehydrogenase
MDIAVVGTGYVGLVSGACLADFGHTVVCVDANPQRIEQLQRGEVPFFEPGLGELVQRNAGAGRLRFTTDMAYGIRDASS